MTFPPGLQQAEDDVVQAMSRTKGQDPVIDPLGPANNPQTIIAILAHRADRSASKFLKKELSMPKTVQRTAPRAWLLSAQQPSASPASKPRSGVRN